MMAQERAIDGGAARNVTFTLRKPISWQNRSRDEHIFPWPRPSEKNKRIPFRHDEPARREHTINIFARTPYDTPLNMTL